MKFVKLHPAAELPKRQTVGAAGYDLHAVDDVPSVGEKTMVGTGVSVRIPPGHVGLIQDRSGLASKFGVHRMAGVIDSDYTGEIKVILSCVHHDKIFPVNRGDRIAQLVVVPCVMEDSEWTDALPDTDRGSNGFGSTG